jgi:hypothetical protein
MKILRDIIATLPKEVQVHSVLVGAHWTVVCSRNCGMASTILGECAHGHDEVRDAGNLLAKKAHELAEYALSDNPLEASIGVAAINSMLDVKVDENEQRNASEVLMQYGEKKKVALVGHFPFIPKLREVSGELWVIEKRPMEGEYSFEKAHEFIPRADIVAITGSSLINHTLEELLSFCKSDALVMMLGPSTPLSPILFEHGVSVLSGTLVMDEDAVLNTVGQAANFRQVKGVKLVTIFK